MRIKPVIGEKFGDWEVVSEKVEKYKRWYKFHVRCKCGFEKFVLANTLRRGRSTCCETCRSDKNYKGVGSLSSTFFSRILEGAKARKIEVAVTKEQILELLEKQEYKCALSGMPLIMSRTFSKDRTNQASSTTASLDRIDSSRGYVLGNVQWVHKDVNIMKNKFDNQYFVQVCEAVAKRKQLAKQMSEEVCKMKPTVDVGKDLSDHIDSMALEQLIKRAGGACEIS